MLGRLAWNNVLAGEHGIRPYLAVFGISCSAFYAFGTIDEQERLIAGGVDLPRNYDLRLLGITLFLACTAGLASALMSKRASRNGRRQLDVLRMLGLGTLQFVRLVLMEQGLAALVGAGVGLVVGVMASQALVFVTAAVLSGHVEAFEPFFSPHALLVALVGGAVVFAVTLGATLGSFAISYRGRRVRRRGHGRRVRRERRRIMDGHPWVGLAGGACCLVLSWVTFSTSGVGIGLPAVVMHPVALAVLWLGSILLFRGIVEALATRWLPSGGHGSPPSGVNALTYARAVGLARSTSGSFGLAVIGIAEAVFALASAMGVWGASVGELRSQALVDAMGPLSRQSQTSMDSMSYMAAFAASVLLPVMLVLVIVLVREDIRATCDDYRVLHDLGCSRHDISRSVGVRVMLGFFLPWALAVATALVLLLAELPRLSGFGAFRMALGFVWGMAISGAFVLVFELVTYRMCSHVVDRALRADRNR